MDDSSKTWEQLLAEVRGLRGQLGESHRPSGRPSSRGIEPYEERLLRSVAENVPIVVFALDPKGVITVCEGKGLECLGCRPEQLTGRSVLEVFQDVAQVEYTLQRVLTEESASTVLEMGDTALEIYHHCLRDSRGKGAGAVGVAIDVTRHREAEQRLRAGQQLMERMLCSHERDRELLAYEIHDGLVQEATGTQMRLEALLRTDQLPPGPVRDQVRAAVSSLRKSVAEARQLISGLRPPVLTELGMVPAIEYLVEDRQSDKLLITFAADVQSRRLEPLLEATIYRIVQEAITNAERHSRSDRMEVRLIEVGQRIRLEIEDWGVGFDPAQIPENRFGLQGIRERARLLRGRAVVDSAPGEGTRIFVDLPVAYALDKGISAKVGVTNE